MAWDGIVFAQTLVSPPRRMQWVITGRAAGFHAIHFGSQRLCPVSPRKLVGRLCSGWWDHWIAEQRVVSRIRSTWFAMRVFTTQALSYPGFEPCEEINRVPAGWHATFPANWDGTRLLAGFFLGNVAARSAICLHDAPYLRLSNWQISRHILRLFIQGVPQPDHFCMVWTEVWYVLRRPTFSRPVPEKWWMLKCCVLCMSVLQEVLNWLWLSIPASCPWDRSMGLKTSLVHWTKFIQQGLVLYLQQNGQGWIQICNYSRLYINLGKLYTLYFPETWAWQTITRIDTLFTISIIIFKYI